MKVGSLVECLTFPSIPKEFRSSIDWLPVTGEIYTVREICKDEIDGTLLLRLEEGIIGYSPTGTEWALPIKYFREVQPPMNINIEEILKEENICLRYQMN